MMPQPSHQNYDTFTPQMLRYTTAPHAVRRRTEQHSIQTMTGKQQSLFSREPLLLLSGLAGIAWFILTVSQMFTVMHCSYAGTAYEIAIHELRVGISIFLQLPSIVTAFVAIVLTWYSWLMRKSSFSLYSGILFGAAILIGCGRPLGYIPFMLISFAAYIKSKRKERI